MIQTQHVNGEDIAYLQLNPQEQRTVVFIHGTFSSITWWKQTIDTVQPKTHVLAIDLRGFGNSSNHNHVKCLDDFAKDVGELCKIKQLKNVTIVGWSLGGIVSMKVAELYPELVRNIVLTCSVGHLGINFKDSMDNQIKTLEDIRKYDKFQIMDKAISTKNFARVKKNMEMFLITYIKEKYLPRIDELLHTTFQQRNYFETLYCLANPNIHIDKIKAKWLVVIGQYDAVTPMWNIQPTLDYLKAHNYDHKVKIFQNAGHMVPLEHPQQYCQLLREIIDS